MLEKGHRVTRTRSVKTKKHLNVTISVDDVYVNGNGECFVSWNTTLKHIKDKIIKKEHIYILNAMERGKIRSRIYYDTLFIPVEDTMATQNSPIILSFKITNSRTIKKQIKSDEKKNTPKVGKDF